MLLLQCVGHRDMPNRTWSVFRLDLRAVTIRSRCSKSNVR
jgi:hypothetical protein